MCLEIEIEQKLKTKDEGAVVANRPVHPTPHKLPVITMLWLLSLDLIEREIADGDYGRKRGKRRIL